jgi:hypothetical protein
VSLRPSQRNLLGLLPGLEVILAGLLSFPWLSVVSHSCRDNSWWQQSSRSALWGQGCAPHSPHTLGLPSSMRVRQVLTATHVTSDSIQV